MSLWSRAVLVALAVVVAAVALAWGGPRRAGEVAVYTSVDDEYSKPLAARFTQRTGIPDIVGEIAAAAKEQAAGLEQITRAIGDVDKVTQHGKPFFRLAVKDRVHRLRVQCPRKLWIAFDSRQHGRFIISRQGDFTPSPNGDRPPSVYSSIR